MYCNKVKTPLIILVCIWECNRLNDPVTVTVDPAQPKVRVCYLQYLLSYQSLNNDEIYSQTAGSQKYFDNVSQIVWRAAKGSLPEKGRDTLWKI